MDVWTGILQRELARMERQAERYQRLKQIHRVGFSDRYLLFRHSAADISSDEFDRALDGLPEPGERRDS